MALVTELQTLVTANNKSFINAFSQAEAAAGALNKSIGFLKAGIAGAFAGITVGKFLDMAHNIDEAADAAAKFGTSFQSWQRLTYIADRADSSIESVQMGVRKLTAALADPSDKTRSVLKELGLNADQLKQQDLVGRYLEVIDALSKIRDQSSQADLATGIFGKAAFDQLPFIKADLKAINKEYDDLIPKLSQAQTDNVSALDDAMKRFRAVIMGSGNIIVAELSPVFTFLTNQATIFLSTWSNIIGKIKSGISLLKPDYGNSNNPFKDGFLPNGVSDAKAAELGFTLKSSIPSAPDMKFGTAVDAFSTATGEFKSTIAKIPPDMFGTKIGTLRNDAISKQFDDQLNRVFGEIVKPKEYKPDASFDRAVQDIYKAIYEGKDKNQLQPMFDFAKELANRLPDNARVNNEIISELQKLQKVANPDQKPIPIDIKVSTTPGFYAEIVNNPTIKGAITDGVTTAFVAASNVSN